VGASRVALAGTGSKRHACVAPLARPASAPRAAAAAAAAAAKGGGATPEPYSEALQRREAALWERQVALTEAQAAEARANYEAVRALCDALREQLEEERRGGEARERELRAENRELRAQLLFLMQQLAASGAGGAEGALRFGGAGGGDAAAARLPSAASPPPQEQQPEEAEHYAQRLREAVEARGAPAGAAAADGLAADLRAFMAAVDGDDVLAPDFAARAFDRAGSSSSSASSAPPAPPPPTPAPAAPPPPATPASAAAAAAAAPPAGPPPTLALGADDPFWVDQLHTGLIEGGYFPGEDEVDEFFFGEGTQAALLTAQACEGLPETGVADFPVWRFILGPGLQPRPSRDAMAPAEGENAAPAPAPGTPGGAADADGNSKPFAELFEETFYEERTFGADGAERDEVRYASTRVTASGAASASASMGGFGGNTSTAAPGVWPVLMEGDSGRLVHSLQVLLRRAGCHCDRDEAEWWMFGATTVTALRTFQACAGLPETGVANEALWRALAEPGTAPADLQDVRSGGSDDEDLEFTGEDRVFLLGENRWEDRSRLRPQ
jgi:peptidoglycan hydrolase-like protein with peptidoglycan-binding domain